MRGEDRIRPQRVGCPAKEATTSGAPKLRRFARAWRVALGVVVAGALAIAALARTDGALGRRSRSLAGGIRQEIRVLFRRGEEKADRAGRRVQEAAEVVGETAVDLAHGPGPLSE